MGPLSDLDLARLAQTFELCRLHDVSAIRIGDIEAQFAPRSALPATAAPNPPQDVDEDLLFFHETALVPGPRGA